MSSLLIPAPARQIDPRGQRFGAGVSAIVLASAIVLNAPWLAVLVGVNLALSSLLGTKWFLPSRVWPYVRRSLRLGPTEREHEYPPRFAQAMGATFLGLAAIGFLLGAPVLGWLLTAAVAGLQTLLAVTGICVGCRLYFLRWWVPSAYARVIRRSDRRTRLDVPHLDRIG
ncbi:MAG: DUF4395 domain-containing protein [Chloroflexota bacterium]